MFIQDGIKFVQNFAGVISKSTPHLYLSGLPFSPSRSALAKMVTTKFPNIVQIARGQHQDWPSNQHVLQGHKGSVLSVAFSPDGRHIVLALWIAQSEFGMHRQVPRWATLCNGTQTQSGQLHSHQMEGTLCQALGMTQSEFGMHRQVPRWAILCKGTLPQSGQLHSHQMEGTLCQAQGITQSEYGMHR